MNLVEILRERIQKLERRKTEIEDAISKPDAATSPGYASLLRELGSLGKVLDPWQEYASTAEQLGEVRELSESKDGEIAELAMEEIPDLEARLLDL